MTSGRRTVPDSFAQRGVITQYHLGERLGRFVTTLDELVNRGRRRVSSRTSSGVFRTRRPSSIA